MALHSWYPWGYRLEQQLALNITTLIYPILNRIKSVKTGHIYWAALCSVAYFYMVSSWGGYVFLINLIPMHVFVLMVSGRFSHR